MKILFTVASPFLLVASFCSVSLFSCCQEYKVLFDGSKYYYDQEKKGKKWLEYKAAFANAIYLHEIITEKDTSFTLQILPSSHNSTFACGSGELKLNFDNPREFKRFLDNYYLNEDLKDKPCQVFKSQPPQPEYKLITSFEQTYKLLIFDDTYVYPLHYATMSGLYEAFSCEVYGGCW